MTTPDHSKENQHDPLEHLLQQAFTMELARSADPAMVDLITRQIAREQKVRHRILGGIAVLALLMILGVVMPALGSLAGAISLPALPASSVLSALPPLPAVNATTLALLLIVCLAPWLYALVDDPF